MVLCDTVATKSHNHSSVIASYTANVEHCCRVGAGSTGTAILSLAGTGLGYPGFHTGELRYLKNREMFYLVVFMQKLSKSLCFIQLLLFESCLIQA